MLCHIDPQRWREGRTWLSTNDSMSIPARRFLLGGMPAFKHQRNGFIQHRMGAVESRE
jgi:hypothetical protein